MPTEDDMRAAMQSYIDRFNDGDGPGLAAPFDDAGRIVDMKAYHGPGDVRSW